MKLAVRRAVRSDAELVERVAAGDLGALGELYDRHHTRVRDFVARALPLADAEDSVHEVFLTLVRIAPRFDGRMSVKPFLLGIAAQHVRRHRRARMRWAEGLAVVAQRIHEWVRRTPEDEATDAEELARFEAALARLSVEKRLVFLMVEREGMTGEEVARALDVPIGTVWTRLHYAWADIRKSMVRGRQA